MIDCYGIFVYNLIKIHIVLERVGKNRFFFIAGIAYLNGVCNSYRVSINEEYGMFKGSGVLAHELGHK